MPTRKTTPDPGRLDRVIAEDRLARAASEKGYRAQALKLYPWICGRCAREFTRANLQLLEVHHRDGNHDNNPTDGSNWELLCTYCHEAEHRKLLDRGGHGGEPAGSANKPAATHRPFDKLGELLKQKPGKDREP